MGKLKRELPTVLEITRWKLYAKGKDVRKSKWWIIEGINEKLDARIQRQRELEKAMRHGK